MLKLSEFDYELSKDLIALEPPPRRPEARLLYVSRNGEEISHHRFDDLLGFLTKGDILVLNNTKVIPARLFGRKATGGKIEGFLLEENPNHEWRVLLRPGGRVSKGAHLVFGENGISLQAEVLNDPCPNSVERILRFLGGSEEIQEKIRKIGHVPLPPYINRPDNDLDRELYQTVFAEKEGAVASPTAGLHFDRNLLDQISNRGVEIVYVTLHVSYATFRPIHVEEIEKHEMFEERFEVTREAARQLNCGLKEGRRIIACGTTSVRTLESAVNVAGEIVPQQGKTRLFIYPPYPFKVVQGLITNFHLPKSSLLLLVAAFLGKDKLFRAYEEAIQKGYRFYSYGDAMVIL
ncbi:MAG: tRNA preQ1(34) S-adenosylmethionine ribosyltransferase-isomerase QueA [Candidatus Omnitrophica bacterium]|nr:tRNA preQ1(34) S-adenosylmethionine ribosyltransferase-isomerase QueA [Candidatus Omnitrophota bacterium]